MTKAPQREMRFIADKSAGTIEIVMLADGLPIQNASIKWTQSQAEDFAMKLVKAIEHLQSGKTGLFMPEKPSNALVN